MCLSMSRALREANHHNGDHGTAAGKPAGAILWRSYPRLENGWRRSGLFINVGSHNLSDSLGVRRHLRTEAMRQNGSYINAVQGLRHATAQVAGVEARIPLYCGQSCCKKRPTMNLQLSLKHQASTVERKRSKDPMHFLYRLANQGSKALA